jgi:hypothetical protein
LESKLKNVQKPNASTTENYTTWSSPQTKFNFRIIFSPRTPKKRMALINVTNVHVLDNPTTFTNPFQFMVSFECLQELQDGKLIFTPAFTLS